MFHQIDSLFAKIRGVYLECLANKDPRWSFGN